jgi:hypothetical protein
MPGILASSHRLPWSTHATCHEGVAEQKGVPS